jgi:hypothetical protein
LRTAWSSKGIDKFTLIHTRNVITKLLENSYLLAGACDQCRVELMDGRDLDRFGCVTFVGVEVDQHRHLC